MIDRQKCLEKEIDLIQGCISRMAKNSFVVKGWAISLASVILALLPKNADIKLLCLIVFITTLCFWYIDAFFLRTEKLYRWKYNWVIKNRLHTDRFMYDLNPYNKEMWIADKQNRNKKPSIVRIMFTKTLTPLYVLLLLLAVFLFANSLFCFFSIFDNTTVSAFEPYVKEMSNVWIY